MNYDGARPARESIAATAVKSSTLGSLDNAVFDALPGAGQCPNLLKVGAPLPRRTAVPQHRRHQIRTLPALLLAGTRSGVISEWMPVIGAGYRRSKSCRHFPPGIVT